MNDISAVSGSQRLTSQTKVSLESTQKPTQVEASIETKEIQKFEVEMEQINHAFALVKEIRQSLEAALQELAPRE